MTPTSQRLDTMPTGPQGESPIEGKLQNCATFGTFVPETDRDPSKAMCHGGVYEGDFYQACPVKVECKTHTLLANIRPKPKEEEKRKELTLADLINTRTLTKEEKQQRVNPFVLPPLQVPRLEDLPTQQGTTQPVITPAPAAQPQHTVVPAAVANNITQRINNLNTMLESIWPVVMQAPPNPATHATSTPFASYVPPGPEISPTFMPHSEESTWSRLLRNVVQGVIAAIGWHLYNGSRSMDFFSKRK